MGTYALSQPGSLEGSIRWLLNSPTNPSFSIFSGVVTYPWPTQASAVLPLQMGYFFVIVMLAWLLIVAPVMLTVCSAVLWAVPMVPSAQKRVLLLTEFMFNWQCLDLYVALIIVASFLTSVLSHVLEAILSNDSSLDAICTSLSSGFGIQCISMQVQVLPGMALLVAGFASLVISKFLVEHHAKKVAGE